MKPFPHDELEELLRAGDGNPDSRNELGVALNQLRDAGVNAMTPAPFGELADVLANGFVSGRQTTEARLKVGTKIRRKMFGFIAVVGAKIAAVGTAAQATTAGLVLVSSVGALGVTGNLPDAVQDDFTTVTSKIAGEAPAPVLVTSDTTPPSTTIPTTPPTTEVDDEDGIDDDDLPGREEDEDEDGQDSDDDDQGRHGSDDEDDDSDNDSRTPGSTTSTVPDSSSDDSDEDDDTDDSDSPNSGKGSLNSGSGSDEDDD